VAGGATIVQLRDKDADDATLVAAARALRAELAPLGVPLIVNDRVAVAEAAGADGVHIGQDDGDPAAARARLGADALIGLSVTRAAEIATVDAGVVDYVGLGPVFATATKPDAAPALGLAGARAIAARLPVPWIAIGGIDAANAADVIAAGDTGEHRLDQPAHLRHAGVGDEHQAQVARRSHEMRAPPASAASSSP
jgi:thiamine-phosphate pyrophosphorylase